MAGKKKGAEGGSANDAKAPDEIRVKKAVPPEVTAKPMHRMQSKKISKLAKKNKSRLPRREKKELKKAEAPQRVLSGDLG